MTFKHPLKSKRYHIHALLKAEHVQSQIAKVLNQHKSTISRKLSRSNGSRLYRPKQACEIPADRVQNIRNANTMLIWVNVQAQLLLQLQWSPEQIAINLHISHETLYLRVFFVQALGGTLWKSFPCQSQERNRYAGGRDR